MYIYIYKSLSLSVCIYGGFSLMGGVHRMKVWNKGSGPYLGWLVEVGDPPCAWWVVHAAGLSAWVQRFPVSRPCASLHPEGNLVFGGAMATGG